jgi:DNA-binding GntR family transcriptional regulator
MAKLQAIIDKAWQKLKGRPVHIPNGEHRELHLAFFRRLENPFVQGLLRAYWDAYEVTELTRFADYQYWLDVWNYHERIVGAILEGNVEEGRRLLVEHFELLPTVTIHEKRIV